MIPKRHRLLLGLAAALAALIVLGGLLQAIRTLLWDLSYFLPAWLITPLLLLGLALIAAVVVQVGLPWWRQIRHRSTTKGADAPEEPPATRRDAAGRNLGGQASHATVLAGNGGGIPAGGHPGKRH